MAKVRYSRAGERDLSGIEEYTLERWGITQTVRYLKELAACCERLVRNPNMGRRCDEIRPGLHRIPCESHVIFYRVDEEGILVSRILHKKMLASWQDFE